MKGHNPNSHRTATEVALVLCAAWFVPAAALGKPVTAEQARTAVSAWLAVEPAPLGATLGRQVKEVRSYPDAQNAGVYYVAFLDPAGFVIVSGDDLVEPIIGFAPAGTYEPSVDNPLGALVINDMSGRMSDARTAQAQVAKGAGLAANATFQEARGKWSMLLATGVRPAGLTTLSDLRVPALVQSRWDQSTQCAQACFNYYTPVGPEGSADNAVCGCTATAMAQLMRYHQHPTMGVGTASFPISVCGTAQTASLRGGDGLGGPYDWAAMPLDPDAKCSSLTLAQRQAIGALCSDAGVSVNMDYCTESGAWLVFDMRRDAVHALRDTFQYSNAVGGYNDYGNLGASFNAMANPNLDAGLPVLLHVGGGVGEHSIVCDGYGYDMATLYHHLNLGWSGAYNAWYNMPDIDDVGFDTVRGCAYNIFVTGSGEIISGRVTDTSGQPVAGATVTAQRLGGGAYTATTNDRGIYALVGVPSNSSYAVSAAKATCGFPTRNVTTGVSLDYVNASGNCWGVDFVGACGCPAPTVSTVTPNAGAQGKTLTGVAIIGTGFISGQTTVRLTRSGHADVPATNVLVRDANHLTCDLTLSGRAGTWNVVVTTCATGGLTGGFTINACGPYDEDFETGTLSRLPWQTGGSSAWYAASGSVNCGLYAGKAWTVADDGSTYLQVTLTRLAGDVSFYRRVSSEVNYDFLCFKIDGVEKGRWSGEVSWGGPLTWAVSAGTHTYRWEYTKDPYMSAGADTAWIDDITFPPSVVSPTITSITPRIGRHDGSVSITALAGANFQNGATVKLTRSGQPDIVATGVSVGGPTAITCTLDLLHKAVGSWSVVVTNPDGRFGTLTDGFFCYARGDFELDVDVDATDFLYFQSCFNGPNRPPAEANCAESDFDHDGDVDSTDFLTFQACFNGVNRPPACQ
jgi:hypothetical protein